MRRPTTIVQLLTKKRSMFLAIGGCIQVRLQGESYVRVWVLDLTHSNHFDYLRAERDSFRGLHSNYPFVIISINSRNAIVFCFRLLRQSWVAPILPWGQDWRISKMITGLRFLCSLAVLFGCLRVCVGQTAGSTPGPSPCSVYYRAMADCGVTGVIWGVAGCLGGPPGCVAGFDAGFIDCMRPKLSGSSVYDLAAECGNTWVNLPNRPPLRVCTSVCKSCCESAALSYCASSDDTCRNSAYRSCFVGCSCGGSTTLPPDRPRFGEQLNCRPRPGQALKPPPNLIPRMPEPVIMY